MDWVDHVPEAVAQRIACDCETWRQILDPTTGQVFELGRSHRLVPPWLRKALVARDHGCRWPGCTAPAAWTDAHHIIPWWTGGLTDIDNLLLLCRYHHVKVHEGRWHLRYDPHTGEVSVTRPDGRRYQPGVSRSVREPGPPHTTPRIVATVQLRTASSARRWVEMHEVRQRSFASPRSCAVQVVNPPSPRSTVSPVAGSVARTPSAADR